MKILQCRCWSRDNPYQKTQPVEWEGEWGVSYRLWASTHPRRQHLAVGMGSQHTEGSQPPQMSGPGKNLSFGDAGECKGEILCWFCSSLGVHEQLQLGTGCWAGLVEV